MAKKKNLSYPNKQIFNDIVEQGRIGTENQKTMLAINGLKTMWFTLNTRGVNSCNGKNELINEEHTAIRKALRDLRAVIAPLTQNNYQPTIRARAKAAQESEDD